MKQVEAIVPSVILDDVKERLSLVGVRGMTICPVRVANTAVSATPGQTRAPHFALQGWAVRLRLVVVADDAVVGTIVNAMLTVARRGDHDGHIFISPIDEVIRIRTGERDSDAL